MNTKKTIYLCGPISYNVTQAREEFALAQLELEQAGYNVINPFDLTEHLDLDPHRDYDKIIRIDVAEMVSRADEIATLLGWENSPGASKIEVPIARLLKIPVTSIIKLLPEYAPKYR